MNLLEKLATLANKLDAKGLYEEAAEVDAAMVKLANIEPDTADEAQMLLALSRALGVKPNLPEVKAALTKKYPRLNVNQPLKPLYDYVMAASKGVRRDTGLSGITVPVNPFAAKK